jgi:hypothetical protein
METNSDDDLPTGWEKKVHEKTNRVYYLDHVNKKTSWSKPAGKAQDEPIAIDSHSSSPRNSTSGKSKKRSSKKLSSGSGSNSPSTSVNGKDIFHKDIIPDSTDKSKSLDTDADTNTLKQVSSIRSMVSMDSVGQEPEISSVKSETPSENTIKNDHKEAIKAEEEKIAAIKARKELLRSQVATAEKNAADAKAEDDLHLAAVKAAEEKAAAAHANEDRLAADAKEEKEKEQEAEADESSMTSKTSLSESSAAAVPNTNTSVQSELVVEQPTATVEVANTNTNTNTSSSKFELTEKNLFRNSKNGDDEKSCKSAAAAAAVSTSVHSVTEISCKIEKVGEENNDLQNDTDEEEERRANDDDYDAKSDWSASTLSTKFTIEQKSVEKSTRSASLSISSSKNEVTGPSTSKSRRRSSVMSSSLQSALSTSNEVYRSQSKSGTHSVSRHLTSGAPGGEAIHHKRRASLLDPLALRKNPTHQAVEGETSSASIAIHDHISTSTYANSIRSSAYYLRSGELQNISLKVKPIMVASTNERNTCLKCATPFGFIRGWVVKKFHCKSCGELYCKNHAERLQYPPNSPVGEVNSICHNCIEHFSSGDMNCMLRYFIVLRDSPKHEHNYYLALQALHKSIEFETLEKAQGNQRKVHLYPGLHHFMDVLSGDSGSVASGYELFWKPILNILKLADPDYNGNPASRDVKIDTDIVNHYLRHACKIIAEVVLRVDDSKDILPLFIKDKYEITGIQLIIDCLENEILCESASYSLYCIFKSFSQETIMKAPFLHATNGLQNIRKICNITIQSDNNQVRTNLKSMLNILLKHDSDGKIVGKLIESKYLDTLIEDILLPEKKHRVIEILSEISSSLTNTDHYVKTVKQFDKIVINECSLLLDWSALIQPDADIIREHTAPNPTILASSAEFSALSLLEILSESNLSHEFLLKPTNMIDNKTPCHYVMDILYELSSFEEVDGDKNEWWGVISCALSLELNVISYEDFNNQIPFKQCNPLITACLRFIEKSNEKSIIAQCIAILAHFPYASKFGDMIVESDTGLSLVTKICDIFKESCHILHIDGYVDADGNQVDHNGQPPPKLVPHDMPAFHLLTAVFYYAYTSHCISRNDAHILSDDMKKKLKKWKFEEMYSCVASSKQVWDLLLFYLNRLNAEAKAIIASELYKKKAGFINQFKERFISILTFIDTFLSYEAPYINVRSFRGRFHEKRMMEKLKNLLFTVNDDSFPDDVRFQLIDSALLAIGSACGAPSNFTWEEDIEHGLLTEGAHADDETMFTLNKALLFFSHQRAYFMKNISNLTEIEKINDYNLFFQRATKEIQGSEILHLLIKALKNEFGRENTMSALRIVQCLLRDTQGDVQLFGKQLLLDCKTSFTSLLTKTNDEDAYTHIGPYVLDVIHTLISNKSGEWYLNDNEIEFFLSQMKKFTSGALDPFCMCKKLDIISKLAKYKSYHNFIVKEMDPLIVEVISFDDETLQISEDVDIDMLFTYTFNIIKLLSANKNTSYAVQSYIRQLIRLIQHTESIVGTIEVPKEVQDHYTLEERPKNELRMEALLTLGQCLNLETNLAFVLKDNGDGEHGHVLDVLFDILVEMLSKEEKEMILSKQEIMMQSNRQGSRNNGNGGGNDNDNIEKQQQLEVANKIVNSKLFKATLQVLCVLSRARVTSKANSTSQTLVNTLGNANPNDPKDTRAYIVFRMLLKSWSCGNDEISIKALTVLTRCLIGNANPVGEVIQLESSYSEDLDISMKSIAWKQLLNDKQIYFLFDVIDYCELDIDDGNSSSKNKNIISSILHANIDSQCVILAKIIACRGIAHLINTSTIDVNTSSVLQEDNNPDSNNNSDDRNKNVKKGIVFLCENAEFMIRLESMLKYSTTAAKLLHTVFLWPEITYKYSSKQFIPLLYSIISDYFEINEDQKISSGVPKVVLHTLVCGVQTSKDVAYYITSSLPRIKMCRLLKHIIDFFSDVFDSSSSTSNSTSIKNVRYAHLVEINKNNNNNNNNNNSEANDELIDSVLLLCALFIPGAILPKSEQIKKDSEVGTGNGNVNNKVNAEEFTEEERLAAISLCSGILDMLSKEDIKYRSLNDISPPLLSPQKQQQQQKHDGSLHSNVDGDIIGLESGDESNNEDNDNNNDNNMNEVNIERHFFQTDKGHQQSFNVNVNPNLHSLWKALVAFTNLDFCASALLLSTNALDVIMSIMTVMTEGSKCAKYNKNKKNNKNNINNNTYNENIEPDDHIQLISYCCDLLLNITKNNVHIVAKYLYYGDKDDRSLTTELTAYIIYVHKKRLTLEHWDIHETCCDRIFNLLYSISCVNTKYCQNIISSNLDFLKCLQENMTRICVLLQKKVSIITIIETYRKYKRLKKLTSKLINNNNNNNNNNNANYIYTKNTLKVEISTDTVMISKIKHFEIKLALLANMCRDPRSPRGVDVSLHTGCIFNTIEPLIRQVNYIRTNFGHSLELFTNIIHCSIALGCLISPIQHRVHLALLSMRNQKLIDSQNAANSNATVSTETNLLSYLTSPNKISIQALVSAVSSPIRVDTNSFFGTPSRSNVNGSSSSSSSSRNFSPLLSPAGMISPTNDNGRGVMLWDQTLLNEENGKYIASLAPIVWKTAMAALCSYKGTKNDLKMLERALSILCSLCTSIASISNNNNNNENIVISTKMRITEKKTLGILMETILILLNELTNKDNNNSEYIDIKLTILYKTIRTVRDLGLKIDDPFALTLLAENRSLSALLYIFCEKPYSSSSSSSFILSETKKSIRSQDWLPVMLQVGELLQVLILDKPVETKIRSILKTQYKTKTIKSAKLSSSNGNGGTVESHPLLENLASALNLALSHH